MSKNYDLAKYGMVAAVASAMLSTPAFADSLSIGVRSGAESMDPHFSAAVSYTHLTLPTSPHV